MSRRRSNDPLGVSDHPNVTTDPQRQEELLAEFHRRRCHIFEKYALTRNFLGPRDSFIDSLLRLQESLNGKFQPDTIRSRLHPLIELSVNQKAKAHAQKRTGLADAAVTAEDVEIGAREALTALRPRRGRPKDPILSHYVEGLMALTQNLLGKPVMMQARKNSVYDPQATSEAGRILLMMVQAMEPAATETAIVDIVNRARRRYAGKRMEFLDFFPCYGATMDEATGEIKLRPGLQIQQMNWAAPIYSG